MTLMKTAPVVSMPMIEYFEPAKVRVKQDAPPESEFGQQESGLDRNDDDQIQSTYLINGRTTPAVTRLFQNEDARAAEIESGKYKIFGKSVSARKKYEHLVRLKGYGWKVFTSEETTMFGELSVRFAQEPKYDECDSDEQAVCEQTLATANDEFKCFNPTDEEETDDTILLDDKPTKKPETVFDGTGYGSDTFEEPDASKKKTKAAKKESVTATEPLEEYTTEQRRIELLTRTYEPSDFDKTPRPQRTPPLAANDNQKSKHDSPALDEARNNTLMAGCGRADAITMPGKFEAGILGDHTFSWTFTPGEGDPALIFPVYERHRLVDLLAVSPDDHSLWGAVTGQGQFVGDFANREDRTQPITLQVHDTATSWLADDCNGILPLSKSFYPLLNFADRIVARNADHAEHLANEAFIYPAERFGLDCFAAEQAATSRIRF
jgi:hypothetical protein